MLFYYQLLLGYESTCTADVKRKFWKPHGITHTTRVLNGIVKVCKIVKFNYTYEDRISGNFKFILAFNYTLYE